MARGVRDSGRRADMDVGDGLELFEDMLSVGVDADVTGDLHGALADLARGERGDRKSTRLYSSHLGISYAVFCLKKKKKKKTETTKIQQQKHNIHNKKNEHNQH